MDVETKPMEQITKEDFDAYEAVRLSGRFNMFDPRARELSGLDRVTYLGVIKNYTELAKKWKTREVEAI